MNKYTFKLILILSNIFATIPYLHVHEYKPDNFHDRNARPLTKAEYKKYKKYFKGLNEMIGMTISEFIDKIYYGSEIEFILDNTTYFIPFK